MGFFCSRLFAKCFDSRSWLSVSSPHRSVGTLSPLPRGSFFIKPGENHVPCTYNLELCRRVLHLRKSEKRNFVYQKPNNKKGTLLLSSYAIYGRMLLTWLLFRPRAPVVVLGSKLRLPMRSSWPVFPGLDQALFPPWFSWFLGFDSKTVQRSALCRSRRELSNAYLLAKIGVDTAENEPLEGMQRNNNIPLSAILQSVEIAKMLDVLA